MRTNTGSYSRSSLQTFVIGLVVGHILTRSWQVIVDHHHATDQSSASATPGGRRAALASQTVSSSSSSSNSSAAGVGKQQPDPEQLDVLPILTACCSHPHKEVMVTVMSKGVLEDGMAAVWADSLAAANATGRVLVLALDGATAEWVRGRGMHVVQRQRKFGDGYDNHGISALKFGLIRPILAAGWSVLLSDVDVVALKDPFSVLHRDSDLEGMSDGWDHPTAYGAAEGLDDPAMGWSRYAERFCHVAMNSGLFYLHAGPRAISLVERIAARLDNNEGWDQSIYNQEVFTLSHDSYVSPQLSVRVMGVDVVMNSKRLFRDIRHREPLARPPPPALLHVNYHPDKVERMRAALAWFRGDEHALDSLPDATQ